MKRILFLDDNKNRWDTFAAYNPHHTLDWVQTANHCIYKLYSHDFEEVYLDHDLGGKTYVNSGDEDCGMAVVRSILKCKDKFKNTRFIVHSWNTPAAHEMCSKLCDAGLECYALPFATAVLKIAMQEGLSSEDIKGIIDRSPFGDLMEKNK
jgi:hypothetical protein